MGREDLGTLALAAAITISILAFNLVVGVTSVRASQKLKSFSGISTNSAVFEEPSEVVEKVKEYLPRKTVDYRKVTGRVS